MTYPRTSTNLFFGVNPYPGSTSPESSSSYLLVNLVIIDLRATLPTLLSNLNTPSYMQTSTRLTSALVILASFVSFLAQQMSLLDSDDSANTEWASTFNMSPDLILRLNRSISETLSVVMEYLRDRWDAAVAGAAGLHPSARTGESHTASGSHLTLSWDSETDAVEEDPLLLAALRVLALWLREDDGEALKEEAAGLMDMFLDLYQMRSDGVHGNEKTVARLAREPVLMILASITETDRGMQALLEGDGWAVLSKDALAILKRTATEMNTEECELGEMVVSQLSAIAEGEVRRQTPDDWLDFVTGVVAMRTPFSSAERRLPQEVLLLWVDVLHLAAVLLVNAPAGVKMRYQLSASAVVGIATQVVEQMDEGDMKVQSEYTVAMIREDPVFKAE
jgi:hypothetical protein